MSTNRGDMPVHPTQGLDAQGLPLQEMDYGMTIREQMAMAAPSDVPKWFFSLWVETTEGQNNDYHWYSEPTPFDNVASGGLTDKGEAALYFAWRTYYADALLAELERKK